MTATIDYSPKRDREILLDQMFRAVKELGLSFKETFGISIWTYGLGDLQKIPEDVFSEGVIKDLGRSPYIENAITHKDRALVLAKYLDKKDAERVRKLHAEDAEFHGDKIFRMVIFDRYGVHILRTRKEIIDHLR